MLVIIGFVVGLTLIRYLKNNYQHFTNQDSISTYPFSEQYSGYLVDTNLKPQRYLKFLGDVNDSFRSKMPKQGPFRGSCDDKLNDKIQRLALKEAYTKLDGGGRLQAQFSRDPCVIYANYLCEFTDPGMYLVESKHMAPRWLVNTYNTQELPKQTSLSCFAVNYNCCKQAQ
jgi:hypothetical protein